MEVILPIKDRYPSFETLTGHGIINWILFESGQALYLCLLKIFEPITEHPLLLDREWRYQTGAWFSKDRRGPRRVIGVLRQ